MIDGTTGEKIYPIGSEEGIAEACRRIAEAGQTNAEALDLGGLGLKKIPEELHGINQLSMLYLGAAKSVRETPSYFLRDLEKQHNAMR